MDLLLSNVESEYLNRGNKKILTERPSLRQELLQRAATKSKEMNMVRILILTRVLLSAFFIEVFSINFVLQMADLVSFVLYNILALLVDTGKPNS